MHFLLAFGLAECDSQSSGAGKLWLYGGSSGSRRYSPNWCKHFICCSISDALFEFVSAHADVCMLLMNARHLLRHIGFLLLSFPSALSPFVLFLSLSLSSLMCAHECMPLTLDEIIDGAQCQICGRLIQSREPGVRVLRPGQNLLQQGFFLDLSQSGATGFLWEEIVEDATTSSLLNSVWPQSLSANTFLLR